MRHLCLISALLPLLSPLLGPVAVASAQTPVVPREVLSTSLSAVRARFGGAWFLSIPVWEPPSKAPAWSLVLEQLGADSGFAVSKCPKEKATWFGTACAAEPSRAAFEPSQVRFDGDSASLLWMVHGQERNGTAFGNHFRVKLRREGSAWIVTSLRLEWAT